MAREWGFGLSAAVVLLCVWGCSKPEATPPKTPPAPVAVPTPTDPAPVKAAEFANPKPDLCPVSGDPIDPQVTFEANGKTYAFCCEHCMEDFKAEPAKYLPAAGTPPAKPAETAPAAPADWSALEFGKKAKHTVAMPQTWKSEERANNLRLCQVRVPKSEGDADDAELVVFSFPAAGGIEGNLKRWAGQFGGEDALRGRKDDLPTSGGQKASIVEYEGTYTGMNPQAEGALAPKAEYKMLIGVIHAEDAQYYLKLVGPQQTVDAQADAFYKMIQSFK